jgi:hypothetical protein
MQSMHITTNVVSLNSIQCGVLDTTLYLKFVSDFRQVGGFLQILFHFLIGEVDFLACVVLLTHHINISIGIVLWPKDNQCRQDGP